MALTYDVSGPVIVSTWTGSANAIETLGIVEDRLRITPNIRYREIKSSLGGGPNGAPVEMQKLGETHQIDFRLTNVDLAVLAKIRNRGNATAVYNMPSVGLLQGGGGYTFMLSYTSATDARRYKNCLLLNNPQEKGAEITGIEISVMAFMYVGPTVITDSAYKALDFWDTTVA